MARFGLRPGFLCPGIDENTISSVMRYDHMDCCGVLSYPLPLLEALLLPREFCGHFTLLV